MHVHPSQTNPYAQLDAMNAAQKSAAQKAAAQTRKKLSEFASTLSGEAEVEAGIARLEGGDGYQEKQQEQTPRNQHNTGGQPSNDADNSISDWA